MTGRENTVGNAGVFHASSSPYLYVRFAGVTLYYVQMSAR